MFWVIILPILRSTRLCYSLWYKAPTMLPAGNQDEVELHSTNCKHSLVLLRMDEIIT